ncbi:DUF2380 domain-containing protein [Archangium violaceum]|nr:DUF2380 domain-containing protein [Archangium violaceum]QRK11300.1 DUF2380 domain-containing protein [Archangium violaceum]
MSSTGVARGDEDDVSGLRYRQGILPAFPRLEGTMLKHRLFPQAQEFRTWLRDCGINIHEWTMLIPEQVHLRIHRGVLELRARESTT